MSKEVKGVDIDEVVFPFVHHFIIDHNDQYNTALQLSDFTSYHFEHALGISVTETVERVFAYVGADHSHISPIEGTKEAIDRLSQKFDLEAVTARDVKFEAATINWLEDKLGKVFKSIHFVGYAPIEEKPVTKAEICRSIGAIAMIDDSLDHLKQCVEGGIEGVLFGDYPWNQADELPPKITRRLNWQEVAEHFNA